MLEACVTERRCGLLVMLSFQMGWAYLSRSELAAAIEAGRGAGHDLHKVVLAGAPLDLAHQGLDVSEAIGGCEAQHRPALRFQHDLPEVIVAQPPCAEGSLWQNCSMQLPGCSPESMLQVTACTSSGMVSLMKST